MPQFFLPAHSLNEKTFHLAGPEAFHIVKVLRYQPGQSLVLFDGKGGRFEGKIQEIGPDGSVTGVLTGTLHGSMERQPVEIVLYQALLKASHWDWLLEKATELGVTAIVPVLTPRTVVLLHEADKTKAKRERWARVIMAAGKQCGLSKLPEIREPMEFRDAMRACRPSESGGPISLTLFAWEGLSGATAEETVRSVLREADKSRGKESAKVNVFIGPEGGFSEEEVELAEAMGAVMLGLGPRTMRAETAAMAAVAVIQYEFGGL
jgi:16S rRNA (uracil1498-N3)-methyltransferase